MRARAAASTLLVLAAVASGCPSSSSAPRIAIGAASTQATGPVLLTATVFNTSAEPSWSLTGPGSLSGTSGHSVVYLPPVPPGAAVGQTATVTASVGGASASVQIQIAMPAPANVANVALPGLGAAVDVRYDARDVPHVSCAQAADCFAVQGYLHARDRLFQMDFLRRVATGHLAELVGPLGLEQDVQLRAILSTRYGQPIGAALAGALDAATAALVGAYVNGINAYLAHLRGAPGEMPGEYAQLPYPVTPTDIPDWTVADVMSFVRLQQYSLSSTLDEETAFGIFAAAYGPGGKLDVWVRAAAPTSEQTHTLTGQSPAPFSQILAAPPQTAASIAAWGPGLAALRQRLAAVRALLRPLDGSTGSNNWVVDASHSTTGAAMVANDPHLSLQYPPNFYLATLTSTNPADNLDVTGGAFPGTPGAQVGRGKHVGWGVTVVGYDVTDVYLEQAVPCPAGTPATVPFCLLFNGAPSLVLPVPETYLVRVGPGPSGLIDAQTLPAGQRPPPAIVLVPQHGPIIQAPDPTTGRAVSVRWTGHEGWTQDIRAFLGLATAASVDAAAAALDDYATGAQNFVLADDAGHVGYYPHALVPLRPWAGSAANRIPWFPITGDGTAEWGTGVAADHCDGVDHSVFPPPPVLPAAACWVASSALPQGGSPGTSLPQPAGYQGFFITANADPLGVSDDNNPLAHPPYLSFDWGDSTGFRHARITERLQALTAAGGKVSLAHMESIQSDHVSRIGAAFNRVIQAIPALPAGDPHAADFAAAQGLLAQWQADGYDCPSGLEDIDPALSAPDISGTVPTDSAACYLFHAFLRALLENVFADDLAVAGLDVGGVQAVKGMLFMLTDGTADQSFCDDVDPLGGLAASHTCPEQVVGALVAAFDTLFARLGAPPTRWLWGQVHTMEPVSQFPLVTTGYTAGPYARPGGAFTVDVGSPSLRGAGTSFAFGSSGNVRHISVMDPASPRVRMQLPGPERDGPFGVLLGPDLVGEWARNQYFDYATSGQIAAVAVASQTFSP